MADARSRSSMSRLRAIILAWCCCGRASMVQLQTSPPPHEGEGSSASGAGQSRLGTQQHQARIMEKDENHMLVRVLQPI